jgi:hypothetical protein
MEDKRAKFLKVFANVPEGMRGADIIVVVDSKPFTWNAAMIEVKNESALGKKIIDKLVSAGII